jgi:tRNA threonylcarbamoyladenosine biosynthesis protein TsaB
MNILAFDTSTGIFNICLEANLNRYEFSCTRGFKHSEMLVTEIESLFKREEISVSDLDLIVCSGGPGSFTGLRIAMATAKGLSLGSGVPMVTIPTLDMISYGMDFFDGAVVPLIDARKKRFYTAIYKNGIKLSDDLDLSPEDILSQLADFDNILLTGPDSLTFSKTCKLSSNMSIDFLCTRNWSANLIDMGLKKFKESGPCPDADGPLYLRRSEAEIGITRKP